MCWTSARPEVRGTADMSTFQLYYLGLIMVLNCGHPTKKDIYVNLREYNDHLQSIFLGCKIYLIRD